ncbi:MAG: UDP-N-acetylmuramoyl-L-alanyl-D-glutamate--2,6-diaminopimelate ligase [Gammaproteobacteria bacterium 28-57-27]|nr:MAG: UDP-N-acetylmuramoyl-L-alanyl-D-glutamate--2,6-diaminopimelate ligase [Gammaproteobacteria bacterium 28-57-27]
MAMLLSALLHDVTSVSAQDDVLVQGLRADSRALQAGELFVARQGARVDGLMLAPDAVARGAVAVLAGHGDAEALRAALGVPVIVLSDLAHALGVLADRFYAAPSKTLRVIGITGTNGKTSISHFIAQALSLAGKRAGLIGTLGMGLWGELHTATHTTPDVLSVHAELARQRDLGAEYVVMEVSSHALDQGRVAGVRFRAAVFSNLTQDHLDYHADMLDYAQAKRRLFVELQPKAVIINMDDAFGRALLEQLQHRQVLWAYGLGETPWVARETNVLDVRRMHLDERGIKLTLHCPQGLAHLTSPLLGQFNVSNLLAALATLLELGMPLRDAIAALEHVEAPAGRMERFCVQDRPLCVVDYAHTPDALAQALSTLRAHLKPKSGAKLWLVFGCGGNRDVSKRPRMGLVAAELADRVIVTDDNPRDEDGEVIAQGILAGMAQQDHVLIERDRRRAIAFALTEAAPEDIILVAGKGHEDYQEIAGVRYPFSDRDTVRELLGEVSAC